MKDYQVKDIALDAVKVREELVGRGSPLSSVGVLRLPAAAIDTVDIHFGESGDPIPLVASLQSVSRSPTQDDGIYYTIRAATAGQKLTLLVGLGVTLEGESVGVLSEMLEILSKILVTLKGAA